MKKCQDRRKRWRVKMKKAALQNLGCKVNAYETESMEQMLIEAGYEIVNFHEKADVYVINTCSVTNIADRKSRQMIHRAKKNNPESIVIAAGCYVQTSTEQAKVDSDIDIILGNNQKGKLIQVLNAFLMDSVKKEELISLSKETDFEELWILDSVEHTRAFVKVQDGCNQFCSYCIIPYARGRVRSRKLEDVCEEIRGLTQKGITEVVLTGIHLSSYGIEVGDNLVNLIEKVSKVEGVRRIRLGSLEPRIVDETFAEKLSKIPQICPHFHLSLQSGADSTLKRMNRTYTTSEYEKSCQILRKFFNNPAITTDVIVGFPQETVEEFEQTRNFIEKIRFYEVHLFKYSKRQGTVAAKMDGQIEEKEKTYRSNQLSKVVHVLKNEYMKSWVGKELEVLMEEMIAVDEKNYYVGYTKEYVKVGIPADKDYSNQYCKGVITGFLTDDILLF